MVFIPVRARRAGRNARGTAPRARLLAVVGAIAAIFGAITVTRPSRAPATPGTFGPIVVIGLVLAVVLLGAALARLVREARGVDAEPAECPKPDSSDELETDGYEEGRGVRRRIALVAVAIAIAVAAAILALTAASRKAAAQGAAAERGGFAILRGADTLVLERFIRTATALQGEVRVTGGARTGYYATVAPGQMVQSFTLSVWAPGAAPGAEPAQRIPMTFRGDTVIAQTAQGVQRVPTRYGAIPFLSNSMAVTELFTQRARALGGTAEMSLFALGGGATLTTKVTAVGGDSAVMQIGAQQQRFAVDATGRILGGEIPSARLRIARLEPEVAKDMVRPARPPISPTTRVPP